MTVRIFAVRTAQSLTAAFIAAGLLMAGTVPATAATAPTSAPTSDAVTGEVRAAAPQMAIIGMTIEVVKPSAQGALAAQSAATRAVLDAVRRQGVHDRDIRTERVSLVPVYEYSDDGTSKLIGYQASETLSVTVRNAENTDAVVEAATDAGGGAIHIDGVVVEPDRFGG